MKGKYEYLRKQYPEYVSLDQLYRICKISKRSAAYLVENKIVAAIDTGKRTWRYKIHIDDVIHYMRRREQVGSMIPPGIMTSRWKEKRDERRDTIELLQLEDQDKIQLFFFTALKKCPDVMSLEQVSSAIGVSKKSILSAVSKGKLQAITVGNTYLIPKKTLVAYMVSPSYLNAKSNSEQFQKILRGLAVSDAARI